MPLPPPPLPPELSSISSANAAALPLPRANSKSPYVSPISPTSPGAGVGAGGDTLNNPPEKNKKAAPPILAPISPPPAQMLSEEQTRVTPTVVDGGTQQQQQPTPLATPVSPHQSQFCCPCDAFRGWKYIPLRGRRASRSFSDLHQCQPRERSWVFEWDDAQNGTGHDEKGRNDETQGECAIEEDDDDDDDEEKEDGEHIVESRSRLDLLPPEVLNQIISYLFLDIPPNGYTPRNMDLVSCLLTCRALHSATLSVLYRHITIPTSIIFSKFLARLRDHPAVGTMVRRLDFSHFSSVGLGRTMEMNAAIQNLTCHTLLACLELLPYLRECLFQEHLENDISPTIIHRLLSETSSLVALDFCGCSSEKFSDGFLYACTAYGDFPHPLPNLRRLSLHECTSLSPAVFQALLPCLTNLTHLDVSHTQITIDALRSLPRSARLTHLSLARCSQLKGDDVVSFLTTHPAVCNDSLVYLNCMMDASRARLFDQHHMSFLLPRLGRRLVSLNIGGARLAPHHVPLLRDLCTHLEELGLAMVGLSLEDVNDIFRPFADVDSAEANQQQQQQQQRPWSTLRYIDLTSTIGLSHTTLINPRASLLTTPASAPLTVIELSAAVINPLRDRQRAYPGANKACFPFDFPPPPEPQEPQEPQQESGSMAAGSTVTDYDLSARYGNGWVVRDLGRRQWYVRGPGAAGAVGGTVGTVDGGGGRWGRRRRPWWKMGAWWWGMKKVPVVVGEVGGLYGHYMFKR